MWLREAPFWFIQAGGLRYSATERQRRHSQRAVSNSTSILAETPYKTLYARTPAPLLPYARLARRQSKKIRIQDARASLALALLQLN
jgi:hypothetical protein